MPKMLSKLVNKDGNLQNQQTIEEFVQQFVPSEPIQPMTAAKLMVMPKNPFLDFTNVSEESMKVQRERTLIMVKPDGVRRGLCGEIIHRFESRGFELVASKMVLPTIEQAEKHYREHHDGSSTGGTFFRRMVEAIAAGPVFALVFEAEQAVAVGRQMIGHSGISPSGTIRGDFATVEPYNVIHGSDSHAAVRQEIEIWFGEELQLIPNDPNLDLAIVGAPSYAFKKAEMLKKKKEFSASLKEKKLADLKTKKLVADLEKKPGIKPGIMSDTFKPSETVKKLSGIPVMTMAETQLPVETPMFTATDAWKNALLDSSLSVGMINNIGDTSDDTNIDQYPIESLDTTTSI